MARAKKPSKPAPKKRKVSQSAEAKRSRARRKREREAIAESIRLSERAARRAPKIGKAAQKKARAERARKAKATNQRRARAKAPRAKRDALRDAYETMHAYANAVSPCELTVEAAPPTVATAWLYIGEFSFRQGASWADIGRILDAWARDDFMSVQIDPRRLSQIRTQFIDVHGKQRWANMSAVGPWDLVVSEAAAKVDPDDEDSWSNKYSEAEVKDHGIEVYFSSLLATQSQIAL